jgi:hypothetical protein
MTSEREILIQRITDYLSAGGLFNPEMVEHAVVRDLLIDCRDALSVPDITWNSENCRPEIK